MKDKIIGKIFIGVIVIGLIFSVWSSFGWSSVIKTYTTPYGTNIFYIDFYSYIQNIQNIPNDFLDKIIIKPPTLKFEWNLLTILKNIVNLIIMMLNTLFIPIKLILVIITYFQSLLGMNLDNNPLNTLIEILNNLQISYWQ